jgi:hypothetical protein
MRAFAGSLRMELGLGSSVELLDIVESGGRREVWGGSGC